MGHSTLEARRRRDKPWRRGRKLGEGGVAITYFGSRRVGTGDQRVALKEIREELWFDPEFQAQFWIEAEAVASLRHPNIVGIIDVDAKLGRLVLDLVDGVDLQRLMASVPQRRLPWDIAALIAHSLCRALGYVHRRRRHGALSGLVHRDLSAANVLISYEGDVKLTDFGLATLIRGPAEPYSQTVRGKVPYLSPEQSRALRVDGRSDLFALGVLLYELLVGHRPFDGPTPEDTVHAIRDGRRRRLSEYELEGPAEFFAIVDRLLASNRDERFPDADAVLDELEQLRTPHRHRELGRLAQTAQPPMTEAFSLDEDSPTLLASIAQHSRTLPNRWLAAAISVGVIVSAGLGTERLFSGTRAIAADASAAKSVRSPATPTTAPAPSSASLAGVAAPEAPTNSGPSMAPAAPSERVPEPPDLGATPSGSPASTILSPAQSSNAPEKRARKSAKSQGAASAKPPAEDVRVLVGSVPLPNVNIWIDGEPKGRGPADVMLKPGRHEFAAGRDKPEYTVFETVVAGTPLHKVVIQRNE